MTRGDLLRYAIAYALIRARKVVRGLKHGLTEEERYAVADHSYRSSNGTAILGNCRKKRSQRAAPRRSPHTVPAY